MHILRRAASVVLAASLLAVPVTASAEPGRCQDTKARCFIRKYWGANDGEALAVARCESNYDPHAQNGQFTGLFQLGSGYHANRAASLGYSWDDMRDAGKNTRVAFDLWKDSGWGPWECKPR